MIADLHCHFPMHLVERQSETHPRAHVKSWWERARDEIDELGIDIASRLFNGAFDHPWHVSLDGLREGGAELVCSVLYWPFYEFQIGAAYGSKPDRDAFGALIAQLDGVEDALEGATIVKTAADLDAPGMRFVHCVEGGMHLGPDVDAVDGQIAQLADRGVAYITLAHLLYRQVAADAPALPFLSDHDYKHWFRQPRKGEGLPELGRAAVAAMAKHGVLVDLSHMRRDVIQDVLALLDPKLPVIASHVGAASAGPPKHEYNLEPETMQAIRDRDGVIGVILAQHILGDTKDEAASRALLKRHIDAIHQAVGSHAHTAIGSDLDGFIKPTLAGIDDAPDLAKLERWIRELYPDDAEAILHTNVERVLRARFSGTASPR